MRRGEIWSYVPQGSPRQPFVVIVSSDGINQSSRPWLLGAPITTDDLQDILAVPIEGHGWVSAGNLSRFYRGWLRERVGELDPPALERLATALRAALDL
ncbi:MAG: type II toxin-antitoxin system PemK/MazF family toxin [Pseudonocardiales bacterium]|nr:type II toxin-antitoxin system PemK/MazF family toxin [Pseudonocardiales bacterium]